jgi:hypothetical protein
MDMLTTAKNWVRQLTELGLLFVALFITLQILFGKAMSFMSADVVGNLITLIKALGDNGLVGLIALAIILYLFQKRA